MQVGTQRWTLRGGQVLIIPPGRPHGSAGQPAEHCTLYWLNLDVRDRRGFLGAHGPEARKLIGELSALEGAPRVAPPWLRDAFDVLIRLHLGAEPLRQLRLRQELTRIVLGLIDSAHPPLVSPLPAAVRKAQEHIAAHLDETLSLGELAEAAGISPTRLVVEFKRSTSLTPREYVLREKVECSKRMLEDRSGTITRIGHALGFSTSQYFATVFRRFTGISPGEYRRRT